MRLGADECWRRLASADHGVLATQHPRRGADLVPVVFACDGDRLVLPIDRVKAKSGARLGRLANLAADDRATVLVENYDTDWSQLWWVRVAGHGAEAEPTDAQRSLLAARYPAYRTTGAIDGVIVVTPAEVTGWAASPEA